MSHQLSHTFPICDAEAQTPLRPPSSPPLQGPKPILLLPPASFSYFSVDGWLKEEEKESVCERFWGHTPWGGMCWGKLLLKDGLQQMFKIRPQYIFSQPTDWFEFIKFWPIASLCWPTVQIKGKPPSQGAKCYAPSPLCEQTTFSSPLHLCSLRYHPL